MPPLSSYQLHFRNPTEVDKAKLDEMMGASRSAEGNISPYLHVDVDREKHPQFVMDAIKSMRAPHEPPKPRAHQGATGAWAKSHRENIVSGHNTLIAYGAARTAPIGEGKSVEEALKTTRVPTEGYLTGSKKHLPQGRPLILKTEGRGAGYPTRTWDRYVGLQKRLDDDEKAGLSTSDGIAELGKFEREHMHRSSTINLDGKDISLSELIKRVKDPAAQEEVEKIFKQRFEQKRAEPGGAAAPKARGFRQVRGVLAKHVGDEQRRLQYFPPSPEQKESLRKSGLVVMPKTAAVAAELITELDGYRGQEFFNKFVQQKNKELEAAAEEAAKKAAAAKAEIEEHEALTFYRPPAAAYTGKKENDMLGGRRRKKTRKAKRHTRKGNRVRKSRVRRSRRKRKTCRN